MVVVMVAVVSEEEEEEEEEENEVATIMPLSTQKYTKLLTLRHLTCEPRTSIVTPVHLHERRQPEHRRQQHREAKNQSGDAAGPHYTPDRAAARESGAGTPLGSLRRGRRQRGRRLLLFGFPHRHPTRSPQPAFPP